MLRLVSEFDSTLTHKIEEDFSFLNPDTDPNELERFMIKFMIDHNGIGLAAPQIGLPHRVFVMGDSDTAIAYYNPNIVTISKTTETLEEGCLSFPGLYLKIKRPTYIVAEYQNSSGDLCRKSFYGIEARCFSHELDHLNGIVFTSKVGKTSLSLAKSRRKKHLRRNTNER